MKQYDLSCPSNASSNSGSLSRTRLSILPRLPDCSVWNSSKSTETMIFLSVYKALHWALLGRHCVNVVPLLLCDALIGVTLLPSCKEHIWYIAAVVNSLCIIKGLLNSFIFVCSAQTFSHSVKEFTACYVYQRLVKHYRHCWCRRRVVNVSGALSCRFSQIKS